MLSDEALGPDERAVKSETSDDESTAEEFSKEETKAERHVWLVMVFPFFQWKVRV